MANTSSFEDLPDAGIEDINRKLASTLEFGHESVYGDFSQTLGEHLDIYSLDFPIFNGSNPRMWIKQCNHFFKFFPKISDVKRIDLAIWNFEGKAFSWILEEPIDDVLANSWTQFCEVVCTRFASLTIIDNDIVMGYLDSAKIEKGLSVMQFPADYKFAKELLLVRDANQDGRVDYQEFRKYMDDKELELYMIFQAIVVEHNGSILPEVLRDALVKAGIELDDEEHASFVEHVDKDNNGIIPLEEWRDFLLLCFHEKWKAPRRKDGIGVSFLGNDLACETNFDGLLKCEKWIYDDDNSSEESKARWWLNRLIGRIKTVTVEIYCTVGVVPAIAGSRLSSSIQVLERLCTFAEMMSESNLITIQGCSKMKGSGDGKHITSCVLWAGGYKWVMVSAPSLNTAMTDAPNIIGVTTEKKREHNPKAEIDQLLNFIINTFYNKDFLRELISNSSAALDTIRIESLPDKSILDTQPELFIRIILDKSSNSLTIIDSSIATGYLHMIHQMRELITRAGKKSHSFVMGRPNHAKLANFHECDVFINIPCAQTALLESKEFLAPIITPYEAIVACDITEVIGIAFALNMLFNIPLWCGVLITGLGKLVLLLLQQYGVRKAVDNEVFAFNPIPEETLSIIVFLFSDPRGRGSSSGGGIVMAHVGVNCVGNGVKKGSKLGYQMSY